MGYIPLYSHTELLLWRFIAFVSCFKLTKRLMKEIKRYTQRCFPSFCLYLRLTITLTTS